MAMRIRYIPEHIITKLREAEVYLNQEKTIGQSCKTLEVSDQTYYRWRREYGGKSYCIINGDSGCYYESLCTGNAWEVPGEFEF